MSIFTSHTIQVAVAHLVRHISNEQRLARRSSRATAAVWDSALISRLALDMVLNRHTSTLEHLLIKRLERCVGITLRGKLNVTKTSAHAPRVRDNATVHNLSKAAEFSLQRLLCDLEEEVANVEDLGRWVVSPPRATRFTAAGGCLLNGLRRTRDSILRGIDCALRPALAFRNDVGYSVCGGRGLVFGGICNVWGGDALLFDLRLLG